MSLALSGSPMLGVASVRLRLAASVASTREKGSALLLRLLDGDGRFCCGNAVAQLIDRIMACTRVDYGLWLWLRLACRHELRQVGERTFFKASMRQSVTARRDRGTRCIKIRLHAGGFPYLEQTGDYHKGYRISAILSRKQLWEPSRRALVRGVCDGGRGG